MEKEVFLIDSNALITPFSDYYHMDFAKCYWEQLEKHINQGSIILLDMVKDEILQGKDDLVNWMNSFDEKLCVNHKNESILSKYGEVIQHIQQNACYLPGALLEWSKDSVADPWLIASAASYGFTIITFERPNGGLSEKNPSKKPKIPDVAKEFNVNVQNLYYMMRQLKIGF